MGMITPEANTVFVFGSNPEGRHGAFAAKTAREQFGAVYGQGEGLQGNAYALPTKKIEKIKTASRSLPVPLDDIQMMADENTINQNSSRLNNKNNYKTRRHATETAGTFGVLLQDLLNSIKGGEGEEQSIHERGGESPDESQGIRERVAQTTEEEKRIVIARWKVENNLIKVSEVIKRELNGELSRLCQLEVNHFVLDDTMLMA